jgi:hypothetical protein
LTEWLPSVRFISAKGYPADHASYLRTLQPLGRERVKWRAEPQSMRVALLMNAASGRKES